MKTRFAIVLTLILTAASCGDDVTGPRTIDKPIDGKSDAAGELCEIAGLPADCEICAELGWYGDGACDTFCGSPDPDCATFGPHTCSSAKRSVLSALADSDDLKRLSGDKTTHTIEKLGDIGELRAKQIVAVAILTLFLDNDVDLAKSLDAADEQTAWHRVVTFEGQAYDWIQMYGGDTEVGGVFVAGTLDLVAEISDQALVPCVADTVVATVPKVTCDFDTPSPVGDSSGPLEEGALSTARYATEDVDAIPAIAAQQIMAAAVHLDAVEAGADLAKAIGSVDDGLVYVLEVEVKGTPFSWIQFYLGDTEVGAVFEQGTVNQVAEISDGEILGCVTE
ncbi:MAG: hypothetical protein ACI9MR_004609 [Myxococcota bacterium]|jgi:hypothetical protein